MKEQISAKAFGLSAGILAAVCMLLLGVLGYLGYYNEAIKQMSDWHIFFSLSFRGVILGMLEAFIVSYVIAYLFAWLYNRFK